MMPNDEPTSPEEADLQFDRAEYTDPDAEGATCVTCDTPIEGEYYTINERVCCPACLTRFEAARREGSGLRRFARASAFGLVAAAVGSGIYFAIAWLTGYEFALVAIVVGLLVGVAVRSGSRERGGWAYQGLAVFLTYGAIVSMYVPSIVTAIAQYSEEETQATSTAPAGAGNDAGGANDIKLQAGASEESSAGEKLVGLVLFAVFVTVLAFVTPFLLGTENIIGLLIIAFALYEAWKINKRDMFQVAGPFALGAHDGHVVPPLPPGE